MLAVISLGIIALTLNWFDVATLDRHFDAAAGGLLAAIGGFFIPIIFGHLVPHTGFDTGWLFLAIVAFVFALLGLAGRNPPASRS